MEQSPEDLIRTMFRETRKELAAAGKVQVLLGRLRSKTGVAALCRRVGIPSNEDDR